MNIKDLPKRILRRVSRGHLIIVGVMLVFGVFLLILGATSARLFANDTRENQLDVRASRYNVYLKEAFSQPSVLRPGNNIEKKAWVINEGTMPAFARVKVLPTLISADGTTFLQADIGSGELSYDGTLDTTHWRDGGDGYYYYLGVVAPGASTETLFEKVKLSSTVGDGFPNARLTVTLLCETVHNDGYAYRTAWWNGNAATAPAGATLLGIDTILKALIQ